MALKASRCYSLNKPLLQKVQGLHLCRGLKNIIQLVKAYVHNNLEQNQINMVVSKPYPKVKEQELQTLCKNISKLTKTKGFNNKHNKDERMKEKNYTHNIHNNNYLN